MFQIIYLNIDPFNLKKDFFLKKSVWCIVGKNKKQLHGWLFEVFNG